MQQDWLLFPQQELQLHAPENETIFLVLRMLATSMRTFPLQAKFAAKRNTFRSELLSSILGSQKLLTKFHDFPQIPQIPQLCGSRNENTQKLSGFRMKFHEVVFQISPIIPGFPGCVGTLLKFTHETDSRCIFFTCKEGPLLE